MSTQRLNPLADLAEFAPKKGAKPKPPAAVIEKISDDNGFPSRQAKKPPAKKTPRRRTTGRNQQLNIKATSATIEKFYAMADALDVPLGELLDRALNALTKEKK